MVGVDDHARHAQVAGHGQSFIHSSTSDARVYGEPWPFALADIRVPVSVWHGTHDAQVPVSIGRHYTKFIPTARGTFPNEEGHVSIVTNYIEAIIGDLRAP